MKANKARAFHGTYDTHDWRWLFCLLLLYGSGFGSLRLCLWGVGFFLMGFTQYRVHITGFGRLFRLVISLQGFATSTKIRGRIVLLHFNAFLFCLYTALWVLGHTYEGLRYTSRVFLCLLGIYYEFRDLFTQCLCVSLFFGCDIILSAFVTAMIFGWVVSILLHNLYVMCLLGKDCERYTKYSSSHQFTLVVISRA